MYFPVLPPLRADLPIKAIHRITGRIKIAYLLRNLYRGVFFVDWQCAE